MIPSLNYKKLCALAVTLLFTALLCACGENDIFNMASDASAAGTTPQPASQAATGTIKPSGTTALTKTAGNQPVSTLLPNTPTAQPTATIAPTATPYPAPTLKIPFVGDPVVVDFKGQGQVIKRQFFSPDLNKNVSYEVYLPKEYSSSGAKRYPVLYMLHGFSGQVEEWNWYGLMSRADELISSGQMRPLLIVLPEGDQDYWVDHPDNGPKWGDYTAHEVVDHIDGNYRTIPLPQSRAIGGLSMGSTGALQVSMNYPGIFGVLGAHSPAMRTYAQKLPWWGDQAWFDHIDPVTLAKTSDALKEMKVWIDVGANDTAWKARVLELKQVLEDRHITFTYTEWPGDHNADYWTAHVVDYLAWYNSVMYFG
jgi:enterochelin esterase-like enzyme